MSDSSCEEGIMKQMKRTTYWIFSLALLFSFEARAADPTPACEEAPTWAQAPTYMLLQANDLPKLTLIGRHASIFAESNEGAGSQVKIEASQDFLSAKSGITCVSSSDSKTASIDLLAPTLIDLTSSTNVGSSVWKFNLMIDGTKTGIWNQVGHLESEKFNLASFVSLPDQQVIFSQLSHDQYEMWVRQTTKSFIKTIVIIFDAR
jgi:hypothetical protein